MPGATLRAIHNREKSGPCAASYSVSIRGIERTTVTLQSWYEIDQPLSTLCFVQRRSRGAFAKEPADAYRLAVAHRPEKKVTCHASRCTVSDENAGTHTAMYSAP